MAADTEPGPEPPDPPKDSDDEFSIFYADGSSHTNGDSIEGVADSMGGRGFLAAAAAAAMFTPVAEIERK
jgi:hypothetical protein